VVIAVGRVIEHEQRKGRDRNLLSAAEGGKEARGLETAPRARVSRPVLHETILNSPR